MRILLVNVNTTDSVTRVLAEQARSVAAPGTEIVPLTPFFGPESVEGNFESYLSAVAVMDRVAAYDRPYDAVIQAGFGEHGREGLQEICDTPVVDITEAAAHLACLVGRRYSVVTSLDRTVPLIQDRLTLARLDGRCASVRASGLGVLDVERDRAAAVEAIAGQARAAVEEDGAEVICLGCAGMAGLDTAVRAATGAPVVDGVTAAVPLAESLVGLGLTTSRTRAYATPRPKAVTGWPPHRSAALPLP
ncbi:aspartate/glutamate racemase family protein [Nocardiopsis sp. NPDC050513]|uniref:aspartate/glutamate racemase family protein n=1 Tax=Nocardiopsis sp. NPDC050513 TaxID=3364338 RepID=UPI0037B98E6B